MARYRQNSRRFHVADHPTKGKIWGSIPIGFRNWPLQGRIGFGDEEPVPCSLIVRIIDSVREQFTEPSFEIQQVSKCSIFGTDLLGLGGSSNCTCFDG